MWPANNDDLQPLKQGSRSGTVLFGELAVTSHWI